MFDLVLEESMPTIAQFVVSLLGIVLTALIAWVSREAKAWLASKAHFAAFECAMQKLETLSYNAVSEVEQTLVRQFKAEKNWNSDTAREARNTAVRIVKSHLGDKGIKELKGCLGHGLDTLEGLIRTLVEKHVSEHGTHSDGPLVKMGE